jgi:hypothetical protein
MTVHTKWEILVENFLKLVELFKSYGLFGEPKVVDFLFFFEKMQNKIIAVCYQKKYKGTTI